MVSLFSQCTDANSITTEVVNKNINTTDFILLLIVTIYSYEVAECRCIGLCKTEKFRELLESRLLIALATNPFPIPTPEYPLEVS